LAASLFKALIIMMLAFYYISKEDINGRMSQSVVAT
jgi:hypothetical protein